MPACPPRSPTSCCSEGALHVGLCLLATATPVGHIGWAVALPSTLASKRVPEISLPVILMGTLAPALPQADGGCPMPLSFLGYPTSCRKHCAPGGVKGPWPLTSSLSWLCSEPTDPVTALPPSCCCPGLLYKPHCSAALTDPRVPNACNTSRPQGVMSGQAGCGQQLLSSNTNRVVPSGGHMDS